jgi:hypothetical protein
VIEETGQRRWWARRPTREKWAIALLGGISLLAIVVSFFRTGDDPETIPFSEVLSEARDGRIERIEVRGASLEVTIAGRPEVGSRIDRDTDLIGVLSDHDIPVGGDGVEVQFKNPSPFGNWFALLFNLGVPAVFLIVVYYIVRNAVREGMRQGRRED